MPRARYIKPGFFKNEELASLPFETRLCFIGLWTLADREGRLEDRPKRLKSDIFPYDDVDVDVLLHELAEQDFVIRYAVDSKPYLFLPTFHKHQHPHKNELESTIPPAPPVTPGNSATSKSTSSESVSPVISRALPSAVVSPAAVPLEFVPKNSSPSIRESSRETRDRSGGVLIRSLDPESESESEYKITSSAAPNARATSPAPPPSTNIKIITRLAHEVYDLLPVGHPDCVETLKDRCAHLHIAYDATLVHKALDSAAVQRKRQA